MNKKRLRNYGLWVAVGSFGLLVLQNAGVQVVPESYNALVNGALSILTLAGIISNPTKPDGKGFNL